MNYEVILERNSFIKVLSTFKTKKLAQEFMEDNYEIIGNWFEEYVDFNKIYCPKTRELSYESSDLKTSLRVRKLTK